MSVVMPAICIRVQVPVRIFLKGNFAAWGAKVICLALVLGLCRRCLGVYLHSAYWIDSHLIYLHA